MDEIKGTIEATGADVIDFVSTKNEVETMDTVVTKYQPNSALALRANRMDTLHSEKNIGALSMLNIMNNEIEDAILSQNAVKTMKDTLSDREQEIALLKAEQTLLYNAIPGDKLSNILKQNQVARNAIRNEKEINSLCKKLESIERDIATRLVVKDDIVNRLRQLEKGA